MSPHLLLVPLHQFLLLQLLLFLFCHFLIFSSHHHLSCHPLVDKKALVFTSFQSGRAFLDRFTAKIVSIRSATASSPPPEFSVTDARLSVLREITSLELQNLIVAAAPKTCELDPVPSFLVQELIDDLLPFLTVLCNRSIQEAHLPTSQKRPILLPKLKRDGLAQPILQTTVRSPM